MQYVYYVDEMPAVLADLGSRLHVLSGTNTDSGRATKEATFEGIAEFELERESLFDVLTECRVVRSQDHSAEIWCLQHWASTLSCRVFILIVPLTAE